MERSDRRILRVLITGRVQGVGFRAWMAREAQRRGLEGWVRNRRDGTVEAVIAGAAAVVDGLVEACARGPAGAQVSAVEASQAFEADVAQGPARSTFDVLPTA